MSRPEKVKGTVFPRWWKKTKKIQPVTSVLSDFRYEVLALFSFTLPFQISLEENPSRPQKEAVKGWDASAK